jgi:pyruvate dehydrogenase E2 component (dihydrolipoamide acetyltransferase)
VEENVLKVIATPAARMLAAERGIDLRGIKGSGEFDSVIKADVQTMSPDRRITSVAKNAAKFYGIDISNIHEAFINKDIVIRYAENKLSQARDPDVAEMGAMRHMIAERMKYSMDIAPQYTMFTEYDVTELMENYESARSDILASSSIKITFTDILIRLCAFALSEHRLINASLLEGSIHYHKDINIGFAVAMENGLIVPVIKSVQTKTLVQIAQERGLLVEKARSGRLEQQDMTGGTFTLSNLGMYPVDGMTPIINQPESAIMGTGRVVKKPVVFNDVIAIREMIHISVTADHRLIDGAALAEFMKTLNDCIEEPGKLFNT